MGNWPTPPTPNCSKNFISALTITRVQRSQVIMHLVHGGNSVHGDVTFTPNHVLDHGYQDLVHLVGNSCYLSAALRRRGRFFSPIESGPRGSSLWNVDRHTGNSCYLSAARRRRGRFFSPIESGPRGSGLWNGDRDKHWVQLLFKI